MLRKRTALALLVVLPVLALLSGCSGRGDQDPAALSANRWEVSRFRDANDRLVATVEPAARRAKGPSLAFSEDGKISGFGGINVFGADYEARKDGTIRIGTITRTEMAGPIELMDQEDALLTALQKAATYRVENHGVTLRDAQGNLLVRGKPEKQVALEGTVWYCTGYNNGKNAFVSAVSGAVPTAVFESGALTGTGGVNEYVGSYEVDGSKMKIGSAVSTTASAASAAVTEQERAYLAILAEVRSFKIEGDVLTLYGSGALRLASYNVEP